MKDVAALPERSQLQGGPQTLEFVRRERFEEGRPSEQGDAIHGGMIRLGVEESCLVARTATIRRYMTCVDAPTAMWKVVLLGIIATCRALRVPAQAYLVWAFERLGTHRDLFTLPLEVLTPAAFKKTLG